MTTLQAYVTRDGLLEYGRWYSFDTKTGLEFRVTGPKRNSFWIRGKHRVDGKRETVRARLPAARDAVSLACYLQDVRPALGYAAFCGLV